MSSFIDQVQNAIDDIQFRIEPEKKAAIFEAARNGTLPADSRHWDLKDGDGTSLAHAAAKNGNLPPDFKQWELADKDGVTVAHVAARNGGLPADFDRWDLADKYGDTVAHVAAGNGNLPADFDQWELADKYGYTVAYMSARSGNLPADFDQWELADKDGYTVAHVVSEYGILPKDFNRWDLVDNNDWTVAHAAAKRGTLPPDFDQWDLKEKDGTTVAHVAARLGRLPADFDRWDLANDNGWTVAHEAAYNGNLPADFKNLELANKQGVTVACAQNYYKSKNTKSLPINEHKADNLFKFSETIANLRKEAELVSESNYKMLMARSHTIEGHDAIFDAASEIDGQSKQRALILTAMATTTGGVLGFLGIAAANQAAGYGTAGMLSSAATVLAGLGTVAVGTTALPVAPIIALGAYAAGVAMFAAARLFPFDGDKKMEQASHFQNALFDKDETKVAALSKEHISLSSWLKGAHNHVAKVLKETFSPKPVHRLSQSEVAVLKGRTSESTLSM